MRHDCICHPRWALPHWLRKLLCHRCICNGLPDSSGTLCGCPHAADAWHSSCCIQTF